jgi:ATP-dependent DNA helicase Q1
LPKPSSSRKILEIMSDYILTNHKNDSGIIYCLAKKVCALSYVVAARG